MADAFKETEVPRFSGSASQWPQFKTELMVFLARFEIDPALDTQTGRGDALAKKNGIFAATMMSAIPKKWLVAYVEHMRDGRAVYKSLCDRYEVRDVAGRHAARQELYGVALRNKCQAESYVHEVLTLKQRFIACGGTVSAEELTEILVNGLTPDYEAVQSALDDATAAAPLTWDAAVSMITKRCARLQREARKHGSTGGGEEQHSRTQRTESRPPRRFQGTCHNCGIQGHRKAECRRPPSRPMTNRGTASTTPRPARPTPAPRARQQSSRDRGCYRCGQVGHLSRYCTATVQQHRAYLAWSECQSPDANEQAPPPSSTRAVDQHTLFMLASSRPSTDRSLWYIDSMASDTATPDRDDFDSYEEYRGVVNGVGSADIVGKGTIKKFVTSADGSQSEITFAALHVPSLDVKIISEPTLRQAKHYVVPQDQTLTFADGRVAPLTPVGPYLTLRLRDEPMGDALSNETLEVWHRRLAHIDYRTVRNMCDVVDGMKLRNKIIPEGLCDPCVRAKMTKQPFPQNTRKATACKELFHCDLQGPYPCASRNRNLHKGIFVDDYSGYAFLYYLNRKSDIADAMQRFVIDSGVDPSCTTIRADNAEEIIAAAKAAGFRSTELTCPDTPEQNGRAERYLAINQTDEIALLAWSGLPAEYWEDASLHALRVRNRTHANVPGNGACTKYEVWHGVRPNIAHLRVFGCVAYQLIAKARRENKMTERGAVRIHIGFAPDHKGYLLINPDECTVTISRHVRFDETRAGGKLLHDEQREGDDIDDDYIPPSLGGLRVQQQEPIRHDDINEAEQSPMISRNNRPRRTRRAPSEFWHTIHALSTSTGTDYSEPQTYRQAMAQPDAAQWTEAIRRELAQMEHCGVWTIVPTSEATTSPIPTKWVFKRKVASDGSIKYKARLVACGNRQKADSYGETFAPVAPQRLIRIFAAIAAHLNDTTHYHVDVQGAYLHAPIKEDVYLFPPRGLTVPANTLCKLQRSMYGTHQANRNWVQYHKEGLLAAGYRTLYSDQCVFVRNVNEKFLLSEVHTDDADVVTNDVDMLQHYIDTLSAFAPVGSAEPMQQFCGISVSRSKDGITIHQQPFVDELIRTLEMTDVTYRTCPAEAKLLRKATSDAQLLGTAQHARYRTIVGSLQWLQCNTRPDISWSVAQLAKHLETPTKDHLRAAHHVIKYLRHHQRGIKYSQSDNAAPLCITAYSDSDWGSDGDDRKPYIGWVVMINNAPVLWRATKSTIVAQSTCEAEYIAAAYCAMDVTYLVQLLGELKLNIVPSGPVTIFIDNRSAKALGESKKCSQHTRHIDIKYHLVRDLVEKGRIRMEWVASKNNCSDIMTKPLQQSLFAKHADTLTVCL